ncbi:hypothetical protein TNCV_4806841 [Trichonephila clavipes]|nr:hypothetical protein TNCV_4806841 [Trichonephila clavipes]
MRIRTRNLILPRAPKPNRHSRIFNMLDNHTTWTLSGFSVSLKSTDLSWGRTATLGLQGLRQTNYAFEKAKSSNPGGGMDVGKCIVSSRYGGTLNSHRAANPLVKLVEGCSPSKLG